MTILLASKRRLCALIVPTYTFSFIYFFCFVFVFLSFYTYKRYQSVTDAHTYFPQIYICTSTYLYTFNWPFVVCKFGCSNTCFENEIQVKMLHTLKALTPNNTLACTYVHIFVCGYVNITTNNNK